MFERFTERAQEVVRLAQEEARRLKHNYIGTEHLLLGLIREEDSLGALVLKELDVDIEDVRRQVERIVGLGDTAVTSQLPFTPRSKRVIELSLREALSMGHNWIGTEHILLGLVRENEGVAARILGELKVEADEVRALILEKLRGPLRRKLLQNVPLSSARKVPSPRAARLWLEVETLTLADVGWLRAKIREALGDG